MLCRLLLVAAFLQIVPSVARAGCCRVAKVDTSTTSAVVRVCTPDASEGCAAVLFEGTLALGASRNVCTDEPTIVYQEQDASTGAFGGLVGAVCDDGEVEI
jgi:hypothetical protein